MERKGTIKKYTYLIYYIRASAENTVGYGNEFIELDHEINKADVEELYNKIDTEAKEFCDSRVQYSKAFIVNIMKLN